MNANAIGLQKMEKNLATEKLKQIWNSVIAVVIAIAIVAVATIAIVVAILEQRQRIL